MPTAGPELSISCCLPASFESYSRKSLFSQLLQEFFLKKKKCTSLWVSTTAPVGQLMVQQLQAGKQANVQKQNVY